MYGKAKGHKMGTIIRAKSFLQQLSVNSTDFQPTIPPQLNLDLFLPAQAIDKLILIAMSNAL